MAFFRKLRGTTETIFRLGKNNSQLKINGAAIEARDATDAAYVNLTVLDPTAAQHALTKNYFETVAPGVAPALTPSIVKMPLALVTKISTATIPDSAIIVNAWLDVTTAYTNNTEWAITRTGDGTVEIMAVDDSDPDDAGTYEVSQFTSWGVTGAGTVTATASGSPSVGAATLYIQYVETPTDIS